MPPNYVIGYISMKYTGHKIEFEIFFYNQLSIIRPNDRISI